MLSRCSSGGAPVRPRQALLMSPLLGAASSSQAIAPRNGGVTNEAVTSIRTVRRNGMSVRATSQPIGAATSAADDARRGRDDDRGDQRIDEDRIGGELDEIRQREGAAAVDEAVIDQPRHRQQDHDAQQRREQDEDRPGQVEPGRPPCGDCGQREGHGSSRCAMQRPDAPIRGAPAIGVRDKRDRLRAHRGTAITRRRFWNSGP